jgi:hypothetical protein
MERSIKIGPQPEQVFDQYDMTFKEIKKREAPAITTFLQRKE